MNKKIIVCLALLSLLGLGGEAAAEICAVDDVPAATLLLPYFEVELGNPSGLTTVFSINNASAAPALAHVTLWTDQSIPTLDFDVYLTGFDVQTINLRDLFNGELPQTADLQNDGGDTISPQGSLSDDASFPGCLNKLPLGNLSNLLTTHLVNSHTGSGSSLDGLCRGTNFGDNIARGYVTIDSVSRCSLEFPDTDGYFTNTANANNILWGDYFYVSPGEGFGQGETLVHIEACPNPSVGQGADECPFGVGEYTFYGRYNTAIGSPNPDQREPLATTFASRYILGGDLNLGTDLIVWRDSKTDPSDDAGSGPFSCGGEVAWFPLGQTDVVAFDEVENPQDLCFQEDNVSPAVGGAGACFPLEAQRVNLAGSQVPGGDSPTPTSPPLTLTPDGALAGWMFLNLNTVTGAVGGREDGEYAGTAQAWVTTVISAQDGGDRFSVGFDAISLDTACDTIGPGESLIP